MIKSNGKCQELSYGHKAPVTDFRPVKHTWQTRTQWELGLDHRRSLSQRARNVQPHLHLLRKAQNTISQLMVSVLAV